jgi:DNA-binding transcriptional LysR family regulator
VLVTPAGKVVVAHGRAVLKLLDNAEAQLAELARRDRARRVPLWGAVAPRPVEG